MSPKTLPPYRPTLPESHWKSEDMFGVFMGIVMCIVLFVVIAFGIQWNSWKYSSEGVLQHVQHPSYTIKHLPDQTYNNVDWDYCIFVNDVNRTCWASLSSAKLMAENNISGNRAELEAYEEMYESMRN